MYPALRGCNLITLNQQSFSKALVFTPVCLAQNKISIKLNKPDFNIF